MVTLLDAPSTRSGNTPVGHGFRRDVVLTRHVAIPKANGVPGVGAHNACFVALDLKHFLPGFYDAGRLGAVFAVDFELSPRCVKEFLYALNTSILVALVVAVGVAAFGGAAFLSLRYRLKYGRTVTCARGCHSTAGTFGGRLIFVLVGAEIAPGIVTNDAVCLKVSVVFLVILYLSGCLRTVVTVNC